MKKILVLFSLIILTVLPVYSKTLEGAVTYTVDSARELAFEGIPRKIETSVLEGHMQDTDRTENLNALKYGTELKNRNVQLFKGFIVKAYAVTYNDNPKYTYYYVKSLNQLAFTDIDEIDILSGDVQFPFRTLRYDLRGKLIAVGIYVSADERFLYKENGKLISHWIGNDGYNAKGKKIGTIEEFLF